MFSKFLTSISFWLMVIGALNWGFVGLFNWNIVATLFGEATFITRLIYILVGLCGIWSMIDAFSKHPQKPTP